MQKILLGVAGALIWAGCGVFLDVGDLDHAAGQASSQSPRLSFAPNSCDLGNVAVGTTATCRVTLVNSGDLRLTISQVQLSDDGNSTFAISSVAAMPLTLEPGASASVSIAATPPEDISYTGTLVVESSDPNKPQAQIPLTCNGGVVVGPVITVSGGACLFGVVPVGEQATCQAVIANSGNRELAVSDISLQQNDAVFAIVQAPELPLTLPPGAMAVVDIAVTPIEVLDYSAFLVVNSSDLQFPVSRLALSCTGSSGPTAVGRVLSVNGQAVPGDTTTTVDVEPLDNVVLTGDQSTAMGGASIVAYQWQLVSKPAESTISLSSSDTEETSFVFADSIPAIDTAGVFVVRLTVTDSNGNSSNNDCRVTLFSRPDTQLHIQLSWNHADADLDVHLIRGGGVAFSDDDCHYGNCRPPVGLDWGGGGANPSLDIDDTGGFGPEQISLEAPTAGSYIVAVHYFGSPSNGVPANLKIYSSGRLIAEYSRQITCGDFWQVAQIDWPTLDITPIDTINTDSHGSCN